MEHTKQPSRAVFLSFNTAERHVLTQIREHLAQACVHFWIDLDRPADAVGVGPAARAALVAAGKFACFVGPSGLSAVQTDEIALFRAEHPAGLPMFAVLLPGLAIDPNRLHDAIGRTSWVDMRAGYAHPRSLHRLHSAIAGIPPGTSIRDWLTVSNNVDEG